MIRLKQYFCKHIHKSGPIINRFTRDYKIRCNDCGKILRQGNLTEEYYKNRG